MYSRLQKIGFEAEVFVVTPVKRDLVIAGERDLPADDFCLLGEIRGEPGSTPFETWVNFLQASHEFIAKAKKKDLDVKYSGSEWIDHAMYAKVMKLMGSKEWPECSNIYGTDISESSDVELNKETGKILRHAVSCGFHIHFSSVIEDSIEIPVSNEMYTPVSIPLAIGEKLTTSLNLYTKTILEKATATRKVTASVSNITNPVVKHFVERLDKEILPKYDVDPKTKYRQPGFYEMKPYRFEYRSLPFTEGVLTDLLSISEFSFELLNSL